MDPSLVRVLDEYLELDGEVLVWKKSPHPKVKVGSRAGLVKDGKLSIHLNSKLTTIEHDQRREIADLKAKLAGYEAETF